MRIPRLLAVLPVLAACQSIETEVASSTAAEARGRTFARICVSTPDEDLIARRTVERAIADELGRSGADALQLGDVLFPGREHGEDEVREQVRNSGADGFLTIVPLQSWFDTRYVPPMVTSTWDFGRRGHPYGWGFSSAWVSGGYTVSRPRATFDVRLLDVRTEQVVWVASVTASASSDTSWAEIRARAGRDAVRQLAQDGLLPGPTGAAR